MMLDAQNLLSDAQDLAKAVGAYDSTNVIDLGTPGSAPLGTKVIHDMGRMCSEFFAQVVETFASGGAATVKIQLILADSAELITNPVVVADTGALAVAALVAGYRPRLGRCPIPAGVQTETKKYLGARYTVGAFATTAGKITAGLVAQQPSGLAGVV